MLKHGALPEQGEPMAGIPQVTAAPLPALASLTKASPSPQLPWQLVDLLYCYCLTTRLYNGEHHHMAQVCITADPCQLLGSAGHMQQTGTALDHIQTQPAGC